MSDDFLFADEVEDEGSAAGQSVAASAGRLPGWKVLVVDDEPEVHSMTAMVLSDIRYKDRGVEMISAHSGEEARRILADTPDIACILLDVVMETDDAGLQLVRYIRQDLRNEQVRIILRTGQPGQAPERDVIVDYDINDYKAKTELTAQKLFTTIIATLRSYEDIMALEMNRAGLQKIIDASASLFQVRSMRNFSSGVLTQLSALLGMELSGILCAQKGSLDGEPGNQDVFILAGSGEFDKCAEDECGASCCGVMETINTVLQRKENVYGEDSVALYIRTPNHREVVAFLHTGRKLNGLDEKLVEVFCAKVSVGFDNIWLYEQLRRAHQATVVALADLAEYKDTDTGDHVIRVEDMTERTAREMRTLGYYDDLIDDLFLEQVGVAAILHDVGKVSTPDNILQKPAKLDPDEWKVMQEHAQNGGAILERASKLARGSTYLSLGAQIASGHHERWDGQGYPRGLKGEDIPLSARIVAVVDVFDALVSRRPYKEPWPVEKALDYIREGAGSQFDPKVVEAFLQVAQTQAMTDLVEE